MAFLSSAGFLGLHALATPGVLLEGRNAGFVIATPVGLLIAAVFAAWSSVDRPVVSNVRLFRWGLVSILAAWAAVSVAEVPPLDRQLSEDATDRWLFGLAVPAVVLYGIAAWRYWHLYRRRPSQVLAGVTAAWILLGEASIAVAFSRNWHASWWEWHLLMAAAFGIVAYTALRERHRGEAFASLYLDETLGRIDQPVRVRGQGCSGRGPRRASELRRRFGLAADEASVVARAAEEIKAVETHAHALPLPAARGPAPRRAGGRRRSAARSAR